VLVIVFLQLISWLSDEAITLRGSVGRIASAVDLGSVLRAAIGVVNAAFRRLPCSESRLQRRNGNAGIDRTADCVANDAARPGIKDCRQIDEARRNCDVGNIRDPELVRAIDDPVAGEVLEDRDRCQSRNPSAAGGSWPWSSRPSLDGEARRQRGDSHRPQTHRRSWS
jgi:hypothetical protein